MATSSIFASFKITDSDTLDCFLDALDASEAEQKNAPKRQIQMPLKDPERIREYFKK